MSTFAITGTSRGIGLELVKQLTNLPAAKVAKVFAITRSPPSPVLASIISTSNGRVINIIIEDLTSEESVQQGVLAITNEHNVTAIDVLINNAGISMFSPEGMKSVKAKGLREVFDVDVVGVQVVTSAFLPLLEKGRERKVINISSTLGSIGMVKRFAKTTPTHAYKIAKAGLNMLTALYAEDHPEFTFIAVSPGWLKTDLGSEYADLPVDVGVASVVDIILKADKSQSGKFLNIHVPGWDDGTKADAYDGKEVPW